MTRKNHKWVQPGNRYPIVPNTNTTQHCKIKKICNGVSVASAAMTVETTSSYASRRVCGRRLVACASPR